MAAVVGDRAEYFAAFAVRHRMVQKQRRVRMLAAVEQIDAIGLDPRAFARKGDHGLIAADERSAGEPEGVEMRLRAQRHLT